MFPYPMANLDKVIKNIGRKSVSSCLGLQKLYWQVPLQEEYKMCTAFVTHSTRTNTIGWLLGGKNTEAWSQK